MHLRSRLAAIVVAVALAGCSAPRDTAPVAPVPAPPMPEGADAFLDTLQQVTFRWFWETTDPRTGLTPDRWPRRTFSSVAAIGFALTAYPIGVEHQWVTRQEARDRTLATLRFLWQAPQGPSPRGVTGHKGFFYHFLDFEQGHRFQQVELSTIDTTLLLGGVLFCREYFDGTDPAEAQIRALADSLYERVDWVWATGKNPPAVNMGWKPEMGFLPSDWRGFNEAMLLYVLALGSPTFPVPDGAWAEWTKTYEWARVWGQDHLYFGPQFGHQYSHVWIDFRGIADAYMRARGIDYFENSRRATYAQRQYAIQNPDRWTGYGSNVWGLTASDGPYDTTIVVGGRRRTFHSYWARGIWEQGRPLDDGTIAPTAAGGSVPFAPEIAIPALVEIRRRWGPEGAWGDYGFLDAFNPTFTMPIAVREGRVRPGVGWFDTDYLGIDQGPIVAMIENHRTGLIWRYMKKNAAIRRGLQRAGFAGGWLQ
ncbi:MAG TPA: glucoamylase family protein [Gemmatimonadaceae bacterium]|nr:glucoamylase family protein [Gemmatimonadaceae bacterium]